MAVSEIGSPKSLREARYLRLDDCRFAIGAETKCYFHTESKFDQWSDLCLRLTFALCAFSRRRAAAEKVPRIGYLSVMAISASESTRAEAIRLALRELGYIEGQNIAIEYRYAEGSSIGSLSLRPSWCVSRLISSWYQEGPGWSRRPRMRPRRFPSLWWAVVSIPSRQAWLKALPVPAAMSPVFTDLTSRTRRKAAGAAQRSGSQSCPCRGSLRSGRSGQCTRGERGSPRPRRVRWG